MSQTIRERFELWWIQEGYDMVSFLDERKVKLIKTAMMVAWLNGAHVVEGK
jgi:hypothetical protein